MTDTLSVLLIIGSAVLGPIEAQPAQSIPGREADRMSAECGVARLPEKMMGEGLEPGSPEHARWWACWDASMTAWAKQNGETLPELCERAMREVGANPKYIGITYDENRRPMGGFATFPDNTVVRCFPTPKGYRR